VPDQDQFSGMETGDRGVVLATLPPSLTVKRVSSARMIEAPGGRAYWLVTVPEMAASGWASVGCMATSGMDWSPSLWAMDAYGADCVTWSPAAILQCDHQGRQATIPRRRDSASGRNFLIDKDKSEGAGAGGVL
jgi:hypothetical protein